MATPNQYVQTNTLYLAGSGVIVGATSIALTTLTDIYGNTLTMADFGTKGYGTLEPDTTNEEAFTFTGVVANANGTYTLTGVKTALAKSPYTETSGLVRAHAGGTKVVITDNVAFWNTFANKANDETITGTWTFNSAPSSLSATRATTAALGNVKLTTSPFTSIGVCTITIASPAVISFTAHGLIAGDSVQFTTTGTLPTGFTAGVDYYVIAAGLTANAFELALTVGGAAINTSGSQSGIQTLIRTTPFAVTPEDSKLNPVGTLLAYAGNTVPTGWLISDGSAVSRTTYIALFNAIGTLYGVGDGSSTFNLPNLKGTIPVGYDAAQTEFNTVGKTGGEKTHVLITAEMPSHTHTTTVSNAGAGYGAGNGAAAYSGSTTSSSTGGDGAHNNLQPYVTIKYIIKT